jgi:hypothetical protein
MQRIVSAPPSSPLAGSARVFAQKISALVDKKLQIY